MNRKVLGAIAILPLPLALLGQDYMETSTFNTDYRQARREKQYIPSEDGSLV